MEKIYQIIFISFTVLFFIACENDFEKIEPNIKIKGQVEFKGVYGEIVPAKFIYTVPENYDPNKSYPLIVALHGDGSNADAFHDLWKNSVNKMNAVLLTPQASLPTEMEFGFMWNEDAKKIVLSALDIVSKNVNLDREKIFFIGFSSGGTLAYNLLINYPTVAKGIAALSSPFKFEKNKWDLIRAFEPKILITYGEFEESIAKSSEEIFDSLRDIGFNLTLKMYKNTGHGIPDPKEKELEYILNYLLN